MTISSKILILLVAVTVSASFWAFSQAESHVISACVSPSGIMRLLASGDCKNNETLVSWNEQGEQGDTGEKGEQGEKGEAGENGQDGSDGTDGTSLHLFDADGQDLGVLLNAEVYDLPTDEGPSKFTTVLPSLGVTLKFTVLAPDNFTLTETSGKLLYYEEPDCRGIPFSKHIIRGGPYYSPSRILKTENPTTYYRVLADTFDNRVAVSLLENGTNCRNFPAESLQSYALEEITIPFTEPLKWPPVIKSL